MKTFLNILLTLLLVLPVVAGALWWWSIQPGLLPLTEQHRQTLTFSNGLQVDLLSDPELPHSRIEWYWDVGTAADPEEALGRHQLFVQALWSGQLSANLPSLEVLVAQDPLGDYSLRLDRRHTMLSVQASAGATETTLHQLARFLRQRSWAPEQWRIHRESLTDLDPAYAFLPRVEAEQMDRIRPMMRPVMQPITPWLEQDLEVLSRIMTQYGDDYFNPARMRMRIAAPVPIAALEQWVQDTLAQLPSAVSGAEQIPLPDDEYWTVRGAMRYGVPSPNTGVDMRLLFPWSVPPDLRAEVASLVAWLNASVPQAPRSQWQAAGLLQDLSVEATDELLLFALRLTDSDEATLLASIQELLNRSLTSAQQQRLRLDPNHFWQHDLRPGASDQPIEIASPDPKLAFRVPAAPNPVPLAEVSAPRASSYDLIGYQPQLIRADEQWRVWYLPDQHFGTRLTHLSVHWPHPMGADPKVHAQWQHWFERHGPGLSDDIWPAQQQALSAAQGFRVVVDQTGIHWHLTQDWPTLARWLPQWLAQMQALEMPELNLPEADLAYQRLLRERAQLSAPPKLAPSPQGPLRVLVSGRVQAVELIDLLAPLRLDIQASAPDGSALWRLDEGHQLAELNVPGRISRVSTWIELPSTDHRHLTLAGASLPWVRATLEQQLAARDIPAHLTVALTAPAGRPGLAVILESQTLDPARLNLQLTALWRDLDAASQSRTIEHLRQELQWRADRYREPPPSVLAASQFFWSDSIDERRHFNGRLRAARTLESTNLDGWTFFMQQWLFSTSARRLTVNEVGEHWAETYRELRRPPPDARPW